MFPSLEHKLYIKKFFRFGDKLTAWLLVFLFLITPLANVLASGEEIKTNQPSTSLEKKAETVENYLEAYNQEMKDDIRIKDDQSEQAPVEPTEAPKESDKIRRKNVVEPNDTTGALLYNYPITIASGRNNFQPEVGLSYNSQSTNLDSIISQGWSMPLASIERINKTGAENLFSGNYFTSSLSDELVMVNTGNYKAKIDNGEFISYVFANNVWTAIDKQGTRYTFGVTANSRQDDPNDSSKIYKWLISEIRDTNNNYIKYEYFKDGGQIYPSNIKYTGHGNTDGIFEVSFILEARNDIVLSTQTGFSVTTNYRLKEIQSKINGSWSRKYILSYGLADNGVKSALNNIVESGKDENNNIISLPPQYFQYQTKTKAWTKDNNWNLPIFFDANGDTGARIIDANGDSLPDIVQAVKETGGSSIRRIYLNNGTGWELSSGWNIPLDFVNGVTDTGVHFDDVNGDGLVDLIKNFQGANDNGVYLNNGNNTGWTLNTSWSIPAFFTDNENPDAGVRLADANGDGLVDLIQGLKERNSIIKKFYLNNGSGWEQNMSWNIPLEFSNYGVDSGVRLVDVNGDNNVDLIKSNSYSPSQNGVYLNNGSGTGWTLNTSWSIPEFFYDEVGDMGVRLADINGDGLVDLLKSRKDQNGNVIRRVYINNGLNGWVLDSGWGIDINCALNIDFAVVNAYNKGIDLADVDGDGIIDVVQSSQAGNKNDVFVASGEKADLLSIITNPEGAQTSVQYKGSAEYKVNNNLLNPKLLFNLQTVSNITVTNGFGVADSKGYTYANGKYYFNNYLDKKFSGFGKVTAIDGAGVKTITSFHGGTQNEPEFGQYQDHISKAGKPYRVEIRDANNNLFSRVINQWDKVDLGQDRNFVKLTRTTESSYDGNLSHKDKALTYNYDNTNGNKTAVIEWGEVSASDNGDFTDLAFDKYTSIINYATGSANNVIGLPLTQIVFDQINSKVSETRNYYDNLPLGQVSLGNLTKEEQWKNSLTYVNTQKVYNQYGLVTKEIDPLGHEANYTYDGYNLYPTLITNALGQVNRLSYDLSSGKIKLTIDANNQSFRTYYDGLGRVILETQPDQNTPGLLVTKTSYEYTDVTNANRVKQSNYLDNTNIVDSYVYFDGLGRKIQERKEVEADGQFSVRDFIYDQAGLLSKESLPYFSSGSARTPATTNQALYTVYNYDALKRVIGAQTVVGITINNYDDWKTTVIDTDGKVKDLYRDAYDNLVQVNEHNGSEVYSTFYQWNYNKKLIKIIDALGNVRNFIYNGLGKVLSAEDLHAVNDTTFGIWQYNYDNAGNLISKTAPNSKTVVYNYDLLNRPISEDAVGTKDVEVIYEYDNCQNGIGRLCLVANSAIKNFTKYNALGQLIQEDKRIGRAYYVTNYEYDRQNNQILIINPDNSRIAYAYNNAGLVEAVKRQELSDRQLINVISEINYNAVELPISVNYANGTTTTNTYDENNLYRLSHKLTMADGENIQDLTYAYDPVGNIAKIIDVSNTETAKTTDYAYDDLHRLISASISNSAAQGVDGENNQNQLQTFNYDAIGNIIYKSGVGNYSYEGNIGANYANPHAVTRAGDNEYTYDENGNLTGIFSMESGDSRAFIWDYANRLGSIIINRQVLSYTYDASGQRVKEILPSGTNLYLTKNYSVSPTGAQKHIFLGDVNVAAVDNTAEKANAYNIHADHLTGSNVITNAEQKVDELTDYYSFGTIRLDQQNGGRSEKRKFTGHEYDVDTGLTYANARYYDAGLGRWLSQDSVFQNVVDQVSVENSSNQDYLSYLASPQNLNSYSYVINNPLKYTDVSGEFWQQAYQGWMGFSNSVVTNFTFGLGRIGSSDRSYQTGQTIGDAASIIIGTAETAAGIAAAATGAIGGVALSPTGAGAVVGAGVSALGVATTVQGVGVAGTGAYYFSKSINNNQSSVGSRVSNGHAYDKHVLGKGNPNGKEFGSQFKNRAEFARYVNSVVDNPSDKFIKGSRGIYWDDNLGTIVIDNPKNPTAFRPTDGKAYYNREVQKLKLNK